MKKLFAIILACAALLLSLPVSAAETESPDFNGYLVSLAEPLGEETAAEYEAVGETLYYAATKAAVRRLSRAGDVVYWTTNDTLTVQNAYEGYEPFLWNLISVGASAAWHHTDADGNPDRLGDGVTVAVLDAGVMADHPDLAEANLLDAVVLSSASGGIDTYHGTFVTGLLAATVNNGIGIDGMVPNVTILPICITWNGGKTDIKTAVEGIATAVEMGADVITFSIGGTNDNEALRQACEKAAEAGVILVTCAGNYTSASGHSSSSYMYPATYDCVVTVSACRQDGDSAVFDSDYSYFNDGVTVAAPGTLITSLFLDGNTATRNGTSFATPIVTAMAVMAKQADRSIDIQRFVELLMASSVDLGDPGYDPCYGYGYVNVPAFLTVLDESLIPVPPVSSGETETPSESSGGENELPPEESSSGSGSTGAENSSLPPAGPAAPGGSGTSEKGPEDTPKQPETVVPDYTDVPENAWYYDSVRAVSARGIMNGTGDALFSPNADASRAMLVTILWRLAGQPAAEGVLTFEDVPAGAWFEDAVRWAVAEKIVTGYSDRLFGPSDAVTREQMAVILFRYAAAEPETGPILTGYADADSVSSWARKALSWAVAEKLITGTDDNRLLPQSPTSRAQLAAVIIRYLDAVSVKLSFQSGRFCV